MKAILGILGLLVLAAPPVRASCSQCPSPPCEIQACPPSEAMIFAEIIVLGQETGLGGSVEDEGTTLTVSDIDWAGGGIIDIEVEGEIAPDDWVYTETEIWVRSSESDPWQLAETTTPEPFASVTQSITSGGECALHNGACRMEEGVCDSNVGTCYLSSWCEDSMGGYCITAYGACLTPTSGGCECQVTTSPSCLDPGVILPDIRRVSCPDPTTPWGHKRCRLKIVRIQAG